MVSFIVFTWARGMHFLNLKSLFVGKLGSVKLAFKVHPGI